MKQNDIFDGKYKILKVLGQGGMGEVYLAENIKLGTLWAIKTVRKNPNSKVDLLAEPNILRKLNHPSLPRIFDILEDEEYIYIVEDFVEGASLDKVLQSIERFPEKTVIEWAKQICDVLIYLHTLKPNPIIYRDMKPANLIVSNEGKVKLIDFGIAREFKEEAQSDTAYIGTRGYAAPEQYGTSQSDARTDIYSFGVTLYHLVTGKGPNEPPYEIRPIREFDSSLSQGLEYIIDKCTKQDPERRYQSVAKLLDDLVNIEKFNSQYKRKKLLKDLRVAFIVFLLSVFSYLIYAGVLQLGRENVEAYENLVQSGIKLANESKYSEALKVFKQASAKLPDRIESYRETAHIYINQRDYDKCIVYLEDEVLSKIKGADKDADTLYLLGNSYFEKQEFKQAAKYLEMAKNIVPNNIDYQRDLAVSYARIGEFSQAESVLNEIKTKAVDGQITWYVNGEILAARKNYTESINSYEKCIDLTKDEALKLRAFLSTAEIYKKNRSTLDSTIDKQIAILQRANSELKDKNNMIIVEMLGEAFYDKALTNSKDKKEYFQKSAQNFELLLSSGYERPYIYRNIGIIYHQLEDFSKSEAVLLKMQERYPDDFRSYSQIALLYADVESRKAIESRNYNKTYQNYQLAIKYSPQGDKNPELRPLVNLINELRNKKWIE